MPEFEERDVVILQLPIVEQEYSPSSVIVEFARGMCLDIGALCFLERSDQTRKKGKGRLVVNSTFSESRSREIRSFLEKVCETWKWSGRRPLSLHSRYRHWLGFMDWCDRHDCANVLTDAASARAAIEAWIWDMRRLVGQHQIGLNSVVARQLSIVKVLGGFFETDELALGLNLLVEDPELRNATTVPSEDAQGEVLAWCGCLIEGFCHLLLDRESDGTLVAFPFSLQVPSYPKELNGQLWVFPLVQWHAVGEWRNRTRNYGYDYGTGKLFNVEELRQRKPGWRNYDAARTVESAQANLARANLDPFCPHRRQRGFLAQSAFFIMLLAVTGGNSSNVADLSWSEEFEAAVRRPTTERQGFRTIKYRAAGRLVSFEIGLKYLPYLRRYLQLRQYLLIGKRSDRLFFDYPIADRGEPTPVLASRLSDRFYRCIEGIVEGFPKIKSRKWRAAKQDYALNREGPVVSAILMQHSLDTASESYSNGTESTQQRELGNFLGKMELVVRANGARNSSEQPISVGGCRSLSHPSPSVDAPAVKPDCKQPEGCLFCKQYRVHADEVDIRKLLGARYCLRVGARYAPTQADYERIFGPVLRRIEFVLDEVRRLREDLVARIEEEVDDLGELDAFWAAKLATLLDLGMELL